MKINTNFSSLENYGDFIGPIYNYFKYYLSNIKDIYNNERKGEKLAENPKNNNSTKIKDMGDFYDQITLYAVYQVGGGKLSI